MGEVLIVFISFALFFSMGFAFGFGAGHAKVLDYAKEELCRQIKIETNEYFVCKQKDFQEVIKEIKVEK